jgi:signal transduction histidine kinase/ligand-binding sensor domain-containing protein
MRSLLATRDGSLWVVFSSGRVSRLLAGHVTTYPLEELPPTNTLVEDRDGSILAATANGGLARFRDGRWEAAKEMRHSAKRSNQLYFDRDGILWMLAEDRILRFTPGGEHFTDTGERLKSPAAPQSAFAQAPDGTVWLAVANLGVQTVWPNQRSKTELGVQSSAILFDRHGSLWAATLGDGLRRVAVPATIAGKSIAEFGPEAEKFSRKNGLSGDIVWCLLEDREGNLWFGTDLGLDRFRESAFRRISIRDPNLVSLITLKDGGLLLPAHSRAFLQRVHSNETVTSTTLADPLDHLCRCEDGALWVSTAKGVGQLMGDRIRYLSPPRFHSVTAMHCGHGGDLWITDRSQGVFRISGGKAASIPGFHPQVVLLFSDHLGRVWATYPDGRVSVYQDGSMRDFGAKDGTPEGRFYRIFEDDNGNVWFAGEGGLARFENGRFRHAQVTSDRRIFGIAADKNGFLWLQASRMIVRMDSREFEGAAAHPGYRPTVDQYDVLDGLPGIMSSIAKSEKDDRIWVLTAEGLAFTDAGHLRALKNPLPPPVHIEMMTAAGKALRPAEGMSLPKHTHDLQIDYTALSLTIPERVHFRYKLEGADNDWQEAGARRRAYYNNLGPKKYRFLVKACNNDGVWNEADAALGFTIPPAWHQTLWFQFLCAVTAMGVVMGLVRFRIHQATAAIQARFQERLDERTRIARQFHDTVLQTVQASKLVANFALLGPDDPGKMRSALEKLGDWLEKAVLESRSALDSLRTSTTESNNLAQAFECVRQDCLAQSSMQFGVTVQGTTRELHPIVLDEVYRIGYEAIRNACYHSEGTRLNVELSYTRDLTLRVRDNGKGIAAEVAAKGKDGHFGMVGMRERASQIKGKLTVSSAAGIGTEVELVVPSRIAFQHPSPHRWGGWGRIRRLFVVSGNARDV